VTATARCESCGREERRGGLLLVRRVYLPTDGHGQVVGERVLEEVEAWCPSCRSQYPHRPLGA
jgi:hypothetical protein